MINEKTRLSDNEMRLTVIRFTDHKTREMLSDHLQRSPVLYESGKIEGFIKLNIAVKIKVTYINRNAERREERDLEQAGKKVRILDRQNVMTSREW